MDNNGSVVKHLRVGVLDLGQMSDWPDGLLERTSDVEERKEWEQQQARMCLPLGGDGVYVSIRSQLRLLARLCHSHPFGALRLRRDFQAKNPPSGNPESPIWKSGNEDGEDS